MRGKFIQARSKINGSVSEVVLKTPIKLGRIPNERRSYEERLRSVLQNIQERSAKGTPTPVTTIPTIHFARWFIIRPENYLLYSNLENVDYHTVTSHAGANAQKPGQARNIPKQLDPYQISSIPRSSKEEPGSKEPPTNPNEKKADAQNGLRSWLVTLILFDGDVKTYGREISAFIQDEVDLIFRNCEDYPFSQNFPRWWEWFRRHQMSVDVFYNAYPNLSVARIKELELFKEKFDDFVAKVRPHGSEPIEPVDALLDEFIKDTQSISSGFPSIAGIFKKDK